MGIGKLGSMEVGMLGGMGVGRFVKEVF